MLSRSEVLGFLIRTLVEECLLTLASSSSAVGILPRLEWAGGSPVSNSRSRSGVYC